MKVLDIHHHVGYLLSGDMPDIPLDYGKRTEVMDRCGIGQALVMPASGYYMPNGIADTKRVNDQMAEYRRRHSDRFPLAFGTVEPRHGTESLPELARLVEDLRLDGVVWHHRYQGTAIDHEMTRAYLTTLSTLSRRVPVMIHCFAESILEAPWRMEDLAEAYPKITFLVMSCLSSPDNIHKMIRLAKRRDNVLLDTGMLFPLQNVIERIVRELGARRLLFGSDTYTAPAATSPRLILDLINNAGISEQEKADILCWNASSLFHL